MRGLAARGEVDELVLSEAGQSFALGQIRVNPKDQRVVQADGSKHPRRFALGPHSTSRAPAFARPRTNALAFRHNDIAAREILELIAHRSHGAAADGPDALAAAAAQTKGD